ncbi:AraC family transcriptional regulator [Leifsonia sp. F6_8S_P_1B]|uniref:AraC family transcriptional regulator n=1 Tax=Leifsonia williamsii TaxID=3035919 RepID=A0ABT8K8N2_9MICO|nr:AraC family transcriptional regulator [Leifsonia williamsii]MDN4613805.1 AraC family transcriptional regulator [Leifsonia williamsii]
MDRPLGELFATHRVAAGRGVEQAREALSQVFLPVNFPFVPASGSVGMTLNALDVGRVTCGFMRFREEVCIETVEAENYHLDIPVDGRAVMRAGVGPEIHATSRTAGVFTPGKPVRLDCSAWFSQLSVMIPRDELQLELERLLGRESVRPLEYTRELDLTGPGGRMMLQALLTIDEASAMQSGPLAHPLARLRLEQTLIQSLLFAQPHNHSDALLAPAPDPGTRPVSRAVDLLRADPAHPWTVVELAARVSVSARSLQQGFRRSLDTTPMAYLRTVRLEHVREELSRAEPGTDSVTEAATRWGFIHLGRFAAAYRRAFGEHPSQTLRGAGGEPGA